MEKLNKNITLILGSMLFSGIGGTIFRLSIIFYLYLLSSNFVTVGYIGGIILISTQFLSYVGANIGDRYRRDKVIWFSTSLVIVGMGLLVIIPTIPGILGGQLISQAGYSIRGPVRDALLADSIPKGKENEIYSTLYSLELGGITLGNVLGYCLFTIFDLTKNIQFVIKILALAFIIICFSEILHFYLSDNQEKQEEIVDNIEWFSANENLSIIRSILLANFIFGFGAGILIPFLPLFYFSVYHVSIADLSGVFALSNVFNAFWTKKLSSTFKQYSREHVIWMSYLSSTCLLFIVALYPPFVLLILLTVIRSTILSATYPLTESLLMQNTSKNYRSRVNMYQNLAWTLVMGIGQILGGILIDGFGFRPVICIVAVIYLIATITFKLSI